MRWLKFTAITLVLLLIIYFAGPQPETPVYNKAFSTIPSSPADLVNYIAARESQHKIKQGNNAEIAWYNSSQQKTDYAIVYLHGFSASKEEGNPVHRNIARQFGCNLYLSRLAEHGLDTIEPMANLTATNLWESAKEALNVGRQLGRKVILMGTSTGGSLALQLAATYPNDVAALVLLSPNIAINSANAYVLNNPWGLQIARLVVGSDYNQSRNKTELYKKYWYHQYRLEAAVQLQEYLETTMTTNTFKAVKQPVLALYYYKDEHHQDPVVKVAAIRQMMKELGTPLPLKKEQAIPNADNHVIGSALLSKDVPAVEKAISDFLANVIKTK